MFEYLLDIEKQSMKWKERPEEKMRNMSQICDLLLVGPPNHPYPTVHFKQQKKNPTLVFLFIIVCVTI